MFNGLIITDDAALVKKLRLILEETAFLERVKRGEKDYLNNLPSSVDFIIRDVRSPLAGEETIVEDIAAGENNIPIVAVVDSIDSPRSKRLREGGIFALTELSFRPERILEIIKRAGEIKRLKDEVEYLKGKNGNPSKPVSSGKTLENRFFIREAIRHISKAISQVRDREKLLDLAVEALIETFHVGQAAILLVDKGSEQFLPEASSGYRPEDIFRMRIKDIDALPRWIGDHKQILTKRSVIDVDDFPLHRQMNVVGAELAIGLFARGRLIGLLALGKKVIGKDYSDEDLRLLAVIADYLGVAIENAELYRKIAVQRIYNEKVLNSLKNGVMTADIRGTIISFNQSGGEIMGMEPEEIIGKKVEKLGSRFADYIRRTLAGEGEYRRLEIPSPVNNKPLGATITAMVDDNGTIDGAVMVFADLSGIKKLEAEKREKERLEFWSRLAARLSHEVKNPLVSIKTFAQLIPERYGDENFRNEFYQVVNVEIDRLNAIISRLTRYAQSPRPRRKQIDIRKVLDEVLQIIQPSLDKRKIRIIKKFGSNGGKISADGELLREAFRNILDNSIKALNESGRVTIALDSKRDPENGGDLLEVSFQDNGRGMEEAELKNLFTPFIGSRVEGMGLGFPIAHRIVKDHQGDLKVESVPGKGTSVILTLPYQ